MTPRRLAYWGVFAVALAIYLAMVFRTLPQIAAEADGLMPFDLRPTGYSADDGRAFLNALSAEGRALYQGPQRMLDAAYPALLAVVLAGAIRVLIRSAALRVVLLVFVLGGMLADYVENMRVAGLLAAGASVSDAAIEAASRATVVKSALTGLAMGVILLALGRRMKEKWRG